VLAGLPKALPALARAQRIGARVASVGFDWPTVDGVLAKVDEEIGELRAATREGRGRTVDEMGDVLFTVANLARKLGIDPEEALSKANDKFTQRFDRVERHLERMGESVHTATPATMEAAWTAIKGRSATRVPSRSSRATSERAAHGRRSRR
jgi:ATP diphosphatase